MGWGWFDANDFRRKISDEARRFMDSGEIGESLAVFDQPGATGRGCIDSSQCAAGFSCRGGFCFEPVGLIGGGAGYQNLGCGQNSDGTTDDCAPTTVSNSNTCDKVGCGENLNRKSANQNDCCSDTRCCRFVSSGVSGFTGIQCSCGECPEEEEDKQCSRFCDTWNDVYGETSEACSGVPICGDCQECGVLGTCRDKFSPPCQCTGCPDCHACRNGNCVRDLTGLCSSEKEDPEDSGDPENCDGTVTDTTTQSSPCTSPRVQLGVITVGGETLYLCGQRDYTDIPSECCNIQCDCGSQCPSGQCNNGACVPVANPDGTPTTAGSSSGGFVAVPGSDPVVINSYNTPSVESRQVAPSGGVIISQSGGKIVISPANPSESFEAPSTYSNGVIVVAGNTVQLSGSTGSDPAPDYPTSSGGFIATVDGLDRVVIQPTLDPDPAIAPTRSTTDVKTADGSYISVEP